MQKFELVIGGSYLHTQSLFHWYFLNRPSNQGGYLFSNSVAHDELIFKIVLKLFAIDASELPSVLAQPEFLAQYEEIVERIGAFSRYNLSPTEPFEKEELLNLYTKNISSDEKTQEFYDRVYQTMLNIEEFFYIDEHNLLEWNELPSWIDSLMNGCANSTVPEDARFLIHIRNSDHIGPGQALEGNWSWVDLLTKLQTDQYLRRTQEMGVEILFSHTPGTFLSSPGVDADYKGQDYYHKTWLWDVKTNDYVCYSYNRLGWPKPTPEESLHMIGLLT